MLMAGILSGCSSDFSRFTDGIKKSPARTHKAASVDSRSVYPPAPIKNASYNKVESSALAPIADANENIGGAQVSGEQAHTARGTMQPFVSAMPARQESTGFSSEKQSVYTVRRGDNLIGIARRHDVSVASIKRGNNLKGDRIFVGQKLVIFGGAAVAGVGSAVTVAHSSMRRAVNVIPAPDPEQYETEQSNDSFENSSETAGTNMQGKAAAVVGMTITGAGSGAALAGNSAADKGDAGDKTQRGVSAGENAVVAAPVSNAVKIEEKNKIGDSSTAMIWPAVGDIVSSYGQRTGTSTNDGIDIAIPEGSRVKAADSGVVIYAGDGLKEFGNTILIRHENNIVTVYGHNSKLLVQRGQQIGRGDDIALSGSSGNTDIAKLHFEVRQNSAPVNPIKYLPAAH